MSQRMAPLPCPPSSRFVARPRRGVGGATRVFGGVAAAGWLVVGCSWAPFSSIGAGEGLQVSGPPALGWEIDVHPPGARGAPPYHVVGAPVIGSLEAPWEARTFPTSAGRCYAVELRAGTEGVGSTGPLSAATRRAGAKLVLRAPGGEVLAEHSEQKGTLARCNWEGHASFTVDLEGQPAGMALGKGALSVSLHERDMTADERWELGARETPFLAGGGVALRDPDKTRKATGLRETRDLAAFEPVALGELGAARCLSVTVTLGAGARVDPGVKTFDAPFELQIEGLTVMPAHDVEGGALVGREICNHTGEAEAVTLVLARRAGAPSPGTGAVTIEAFSRPFLPAAARTPFLGAAPLEPPPGDVYTPDGAAQERALEAFEPVDLEVPSGECAAFEVRSVAGAKIDAGATMDSHFWVWAEPGKKRTRLAQWEEKGKMVARPFCNASLGGAWKLRLTLLSRSGKTAGSGRVRVQVVRRKGSEKDW